MHYKLRIEKNMKVTDSFYDFVQKYKQEDPIKLRLKKFQDFDFDISFAIDQIESRQKVKSKLPLWFQNKQLLFPSVLSAEQASSEDTAQYKHHIIDRKYKSICDLTGGLGIDSYYLALSAEKVTYVERYLSYCDVAKHNFNILKQNKIRVICSDSRQYIKECNEEFDACYIDPARRGSENKRLYDLHDCEPDIIDFQDIILNKTPVILLKASPMIDITRTLQDLKFVCDVHIISVKNECKELFFIIDRNNPIGKVRIHCVNLTGEKYPDKYSFAIEDEKNRPQATLASSVQKYLYEPNSSILKAGAFKSVAVSFPVNKLHKNSHLYTSEEFVNEFPGRSFSVEEVIPFSGKIIKKISGLYPSANITSRNFPISSDELRRKTKIKDGGDIYIFATTLNPDKKILIVCRKVV